MNFLQKRRWRKTVKRALHESRHIRLMRMDIAAPDLVASVERAEQELKSAVEVMDQPRLESALNELGARLDRIASTRRHSSIRENLEILVVALGVAMAFRTYFIQPFKIPTGSMQPTLYGIKVDAEPAKSWADVFPVSLAKRLVLGERFVEVRATATGEIRYIGDFEDAWTVLGMEDRSPLKPLKRIASWVRGNLPPGPVSLFVIGGSTTGDRPTRHQLCFVHRDMNILFRDQEVVTNDQILATGLVRAGDHIFVNRMTYNFRKPRRGDVFVFNTRDIQYPNVRTDNYYIKRLVGLPGEEIEIREPLLFVNGAEVRAPEAFIRQHEARDLGYRGYVYPDSRYPTGTALGPGRSLRLGPSDYLPMGDNTLSSLDGRFFGPVRRERILGPAFSVYWPLGPRWGMIE